MKVLLITSEIEDYLQDSIIHGFKKLIGRDAIEYPEKPMLYNDYPISNLRGKGFTLYGLLDTNLKTFSNNSFKQEILFTAFDLIVFTSIQRQSNLFFKNFKYLKNSNTSVWLIDGEDQFYLFPYLSKRFIQYFLSPRPYTYFTYFKRELFTESFNNLYLKLFPASIKNIKEISFSIPEEKVIDVLPKKKKLFTKHIVDEEAAAHITDAHTTYVFNSEEAYYKDIQQSKFGITTKRAGWDCLRHYEIAANGAVICFKNLDQKPASCAPHGLIDGTNCLSYTDYTDLIQKIESISEERYNKILINSFNWIKENTTLNRVKTLLANNVFYNPHSNYFNA